MVVVAAGVACLSVVGAGADAGGMCLFVSLAVVYLFCFGLSLSFFLHYVTLC